MTANPQHSIGHSGRAGGMTAHDLITALETCVTCGEIHQPWSPYPNAQSWASQKDGHPYKTRMYAMTGDSSMRAIAAMRAIAGCEHATVKR